MVLNQSKVVRIDPGEVALDARRGAGPVNQPIRFDTGRGLETKGGSDETIHISKRPGP